MNRARPLLVSNDADLIDDVLRMAAATGIEVHLATDAESARGRWTVASLVLVGADMGASAARMRPPRRRDVILVTRHPAPEDWQSAVGIGAEHVVSLPDAERWLIDRLADCAEGAARDGSVVAVMSAGAGAGASTLASTLALAAAYRSMRVLLVDADPWGGGLDVLLGIEDAPGSRWPDLADTRGRLGAATLEQALPHVSGVSVLSWGREDSPMPTPEAFTSILDAGCRGFDLVVVDLPTRLDEVTEAVVGRAHHTVLVAATRVRSAVAAARLSSALVARTAGLGIVLRDDPRGVSEESVVATLSAPLLGRIPHHPPLALRADEGEPPSLRDAYGRACQSLLAHLTTASGAAA